MTATHHGWAGAFRVCPADMDSHDGYRVLLVGEDNPQSDDLRLALWAVPKRGKSGCAGRNLQSKILGLGHHHYYALWRTNLCVPPNSWDRESAVDRARILVSGAYSHPWRTIVALGRKVSSCFEVAVGARIEAWSWVPVWMEINGHDVYRTVVSIPHPSGLTRDWNDPANYERAQALLREVEPEVPWGELGRIPAADQQARSR